MIADGPTRGIIFDLDGVLTHTAELHAAAWKTTFDVFLRRRATEAGARFVPFSVPGDYRLYVDGRPRYEGVAQFLKSRGIELPRGSPADAPGDLTVCALGNAKNAHFQALLREKGVPVDADAVDFVRSARARGIKTAVATSSKNGRGVLQTAHLLSLFDVVVDGEDAARDGIPGKPEPDLFLYTASKLHTGIGETAVFEDAIVGVAAAKRGGFTPVIGVGVEEDALTAAGADMVVGRWRRLEIDGGLRLTLQADP